MTEPFEAKSLPELPTWNDAYADTARDLLTAVNGFVYLGAGSDAVMLAIRWLRANPESAELLLTHGIEDERRTCSYCDGTGKVD
jgi:hypothetical protein